MIEFFAQTHIGQRKVNEDSFFVDKDLGLYIVADGVGGLAKGEVASQLTCKTIHDAIKDGKGLIEAVESAHKKLLSEMVSDEKLKGMASTVVVALFDGNKYQLAWVGDSRAYLWDGGLKLITRDHSYVELLYEKGHITFEQMNAHPNKNVISQALGSRGKEITVDFNQGTLENEQLLLLATDGLYEITKEKVIIDGLNQISNIEELTQTLVTHAVRYQGKDNITLVSIKSDVDSDNKSDVLFAEVVRAFNSESGDVEETIIKKRPLDDVKNLKVKSIQSKPIKLDKKKYKASYNKWLSGLLIISMMLLIVLLLIKSIHK
jgi:protein phosphatase